MGARVAFLVACLVLTAWLASCGGGGGVPYEQRASWRDKAEESCLASGAVRASPYVQVARRFSGPSACGIETPLKVSGALGGRVAIIPTATINCPLTAALDRWIQNSVQPAAYRQFGSQVIEIKQIASYGCRGRNNSHRGHLSEHAYGNALDVAAFKLANGQEIIVARDWNRGTARAQAFLAEVFTGACATFYTVLGPGSDRFHYNHIHVDLLVTNVSRNGSHYCRPQPRRGLPMAQLGGDPTTTASLKPIPFTGPGSD